MTGVPSIGTNPNEPKNCGLEREHEHPPHAELAGRVEQLGDEPVADLAAAQHRVDRDRADLGQVLPQHVHRAAADDRAVARALRDPELLDVLVERDGRLGQQPPVGDVHVDQPPDAAHVGGSGPPDGYLHDRKGSGARMWHLTRERVLWSPPR